jgi:anti-sigma regulatory factor (Ser/Thr protein kinase)
MSRNAENTAPALTPVFPEDRLPVKSSDAATVHGTIALPGCMIHSDVTVIALEWICRALRCEDGADTPGREAFEGFHATVRVQTFDDIDICMKIATTAFALPAVSAIGLRELVVNAVEHGNLEITFDEKTELLATGEWQTEIERRLATDDLRDRFATVELRLLEDSYAIEITDQGKGFDPSVYLDPETAPSAMLHGRGMSLAMDAGFTSVDYRGAGNEVSIRGACKPSAGI